MNNEIEKKARELADERLVAFLLPAGLPEEKKRLLEMFKEGKMDERRLEVTLLHGEKTMTVKEAYDLLYKEEYETLTNSSEG